MYMTYALNNIDFREMEELLELQYGESVREFVDFVLADPLYNVQCGRDDDHLEHRRF